MALPTAFPVAVFRPFGKGDRDPYENFLYPPDKQEKVTQTLLEQAEVLHHCNGPWAFPPAEDDARGPTVPYVRESASRATARAGLKRLRRYRSP